jgi:hypothetical protein
MRRSLLDVSLLSEQAATSAMRAHKRKKAPGTEVPSAFLNAEGLTMLG